MPGIFNLFRINNFCIFKVADVKLLAAYILFEHRRLAINMAVSESPTAIAQCRSVFEGHLFFLHQKNSCLSDLVREEKNICPQSNHT